MIKRFLTNKDIALGFLIGNGFSAIVHLIIARMFS